MKRILLTLVWILTATVVCSAQTTFYFPHVADGLLLNTFRWKTTIFLTNPASSGTASGTVTFTRENADPGLAGSNFSTISFVDEAGAPAGSGGIITFSIPAGATRKYTSTGAGAYAGGFATVASNVPVNGTAVFSEFNLAGQLIAEAGVPSVGAFPRQSIFVDTVGGYNVGVAYANPGTAAANVTLTLLNSAAAPQATTTRLLGPGNHAAAFTVELFQNATPPIPPLVGTVQITSASPLAMIALRFDPSFNVFTTLPPVTLTAMLNPAVEWLQQRPWLTPLTSVAKLLGSFQLRIG
jgi:hypothetical protein